MENTKSFKGQTEGLIYFVLLSGSRHTDEIKELIETRFASVKLGTLYAQISKMTTNKTIKEFRASSSDGSRRKYYQITPLGLKTYNQKYAALFEGEELIPSSNYDFENTAFNNIASKRSKKKVEAQKEVENEVKNETYNDFTHDVDKEIDFSMFETDLNNDNAPNLALQNDISLDDVPSIETPYNAILNDNFGGLSEEFEESDSAYLLDSDETSKPIVNDEPVQRAPMFSRSEIEESAVESAKNSYNKVDYDSFASLQYEYSGVLNKIFPKPQSAEQTTSQNEVIEEEKQPINAVHNNDWSDIYAMSEKDGIKVRTSSDTNRYRGNKISVTKLIFFTCLTLFGVAMLEFLLFNLIFKGQIEYSQSSLITIALIFGTAVLVSLIVFILNPSYSKKDLPRFINSFEIALILAISSIIIIFALTAIKGIDFYNFNDMFYNLILPSVMVINMPIFVVIEYAFSKLEFFQTL
ncbi:MAG: PadR family transcriptional regulator [Clostridia bacterium]|nr:PadR family transcriptional regulator [Clostridia bacterium]